MVRGWKCHSGNPKKRNYNLEKSYANFIMIGIRIYMLMRLTGFAGLFPRDFDLFSRRGRRPACLGS